MNLIQKHIFKLILGLFILTLVGCEKPEEIVDTIDGPVNTTGQSTIGSGAAGAVSDYFYDFENDLDVEFYHFNQNIISYSYDKYLTLSLEEPPKLTLKSFPDYLVEITPDSTQF